MEDISGYSTLNADSSAEFSRAWTSFDATIDSASSEEVLDMLKWLGKNSTVSEVLLGLLRVV